MTAMWLIILCGLAAIAYGVWATQSVLAADAGNARMQEIAAAIREGAQAYLRRQYATIGVVGVVIIILVGFLHGWHLAVGIAIGAVLSGAGGFSGAYVRLGGDAHADEARQRRQKRADDKGYHDKRVRLLAGIAQVEQEQ